MITKEHAYELRRLIENLSVSLNDETALTAIELFPEWQIGKSYSIGDRIKFDNVLYKCVQAHTSQGDWLPVITPALWTRVSVDEFPEWVQPTGAQDAYMTGDKVSHNGLHWVSTVDNNVWEPGIYGWEQL